MGPLISGTLNQISNITKSSITTDKEVKPDLSQLNWPCQRMNTKMNITDDR